MKMFWKNTTLFFATGALIGFAPVAPGTFGSLVALPLCLLLAGMDYPVAMVIIALLIVFSIWISHLAEKVIGKNDPKQVVIDEICGMAVALSGFPFTPFYVIGGFILFRVFDILKPFPIRWVDKSVPGGLGIVIDDLIAGLFTNISIHLVVLLLSR